MIGMRFRVAGNTIPTAREEQDVIQSGENRVLLYFPSATSARKVLLSISTKLREKWKVQHEVSGRYDR
jgi:hypothetical protein